MKQFLNILSFEYFGIVKNKVYIGITIFFSVVLAVILSVPSILSLFNNGDANTNGSIIEKVGTVAVLDNTGIYSDLSCFENSAPQYNFTAVTESEDEIREKVDSEEYEGAIVISDPMNAQYIVKTAGMDLYYQNVLSEIMRQNYIKNLLVNSGMDTNEATLASVSQPSVQVIETGKSFLSLYIYTYVLLFMMYMAVILYGQMVSVSVVTEKSSRAMELLITTAKTTNLMFGKVIGVGLAGITQLAAFIVTTLVFYRINISQLSKTPVVSEIFEIPAMTTVYMVIFFILGFFIYAFLFKDLGSTVSRLEEINTSSTPMLLFVAAFIISMVPLNTGDSNTAVTILSFIPFFTPMLMFVRICMTTVPVWQIVLSIVILIISNIGIGYISAKIYRAGVLMYGKPPKLGEILKALKS